MRLVLAIVLLVGLLAANVVVAVSTGRQLIDIERERAGIDAQRHAIDAQRAAIELIGRHMQQWLAGSRRCSAEVLRPPNHSDLQTLTRL